MPLSGAAETAIHNNPKRSAENCESEPDARDKCYQTADSPALRLSPRTVCSAQFRCAGSRDGAACPSVTEQPGQVHDEGPVLEPGRLAGTPLLATFVVDDKEVASGPVFPLKPDGGGEHLPRRVVLNP